MKKFNEKENEETKKKREKQEEIRAKLNFLNVLIYTHHNQTKIYS